MNLERERENRESDPIQLRSKQKRERERKMGVMEKLKIFTVQEPIVVASCLIAGFGLILPAVVRPVLDSFQTAKEVPPPALSDVSFFHL
ncbi:Fiber protein fb11 [Rhynchospora pubera]|uniref:Fiber protein fb11 n=1 Tax=Rhynchospora pubera TaxID=906938 RepID=A0AAV8EMB6_9POAL|nr:Fiber protein fb11 [Rhynchospora pubera]